MKWWASTLLVPALVCSLGPGVDAAKPGKPTKYVRVVVTLKSATIERPTSSARALKVDLEVTALRTAFSPDVQLQCSRGATAYYEAENAYKGGVLLSQGQTIAAAAHLIYPQWCKKPFVTLRWVGPPGSPKAQKAPRWELADLLARA